MKMRKLMIGAAVMALAVAGGIWRTHAGGPSSFTAGPLRVVGVQVDATSGPITQRAIGTIKAKLAELDPKVTWDLDAPTSDWIVEDVSDMTQVYESFDGDLLYRRKLPIDAVVAELRHGRSWVFGIVAAGTHIPTNCRAHGCDPSGTLLDAQAFITP